MFETTTQIILSLIHINIFQPYMRSVTLIKGKFIPSVKSQNISETWERTSEHHLLRFQLDKIWLNSKIKFKVSLCSCQTLIPLAIVASKRWGKLGISDPTIQCAFWWSWLHPGSGTSFQVYIISLIETVGGSPSPIENYQETDRPYLTTSTKNHTHTYTFYHLYFTQKHASHVEMSSPALEQLLFFDCKRKFVFQQNKTVDFCLGPAWVTEKDLREKNKQFFPSSGFIAYVQPVGPEKAVIHWVKSPLYIHGLKKTWVTGVKKNILIGNF